MKSQIYFKATTTCCDAVVALNSACAKAEASQCTKCYLVKIEIIDVNGRYTSDKQNIKKVSLALFDKNNNHVQTTKLSAHAIVNGEPVYFVLPAYESFSIMLYHTPDSAPSFSKSMKCSDYIEMLCDEGICSVLRMESTPSEGGEITVEIIEESFIPR